MEGGVVVFIGTFPYGFFTCSRCPAGRYVAQGSLMTANVTEDGYPALASRSAFDALCVPCADGKYNVNGGTSAASCTEECPSNSVLTFDFMYPYAFTGCAECPAGRFLGGDAPLVVADRNATVVTPEYFSGVQTRAGSHYSSVAVPALPTTRAVPGQTICSACPEGKYSQIAGATSAAECVQTCPRATRVAFAEEFPQPFSGCLPLPEVIEGRVATLVRGPKFHA